MPKLTIISNGRNLIVELMSINPIILVINLNMIESNDIMIKRWNENMARSLGRNYQQTGLIS